MLPLLLVRVSRFELEAVQRFAPLLWSCYCDTRGLEFELPYIKKGNPQKWISLLVRVSRFELEAS